MSGGENSKGSRKPSGGNQKKEFSPYPGLNFYTGDDADFFAGRSNDVTRCVATLAESRVLVLHGPTGCGKSSFLRAGVKPRLATVDAAAVFAGEPGEFEVIRSTGRPLAVFMGYCAKNVVKVIREEIDTGARKRKFGPLKRDVDFSEVEALFEDAELLERDGIAAYMAYKALIGALKHRLILVIDQGEEVFTLNNERKAVAGRDIETSAYFAFLRRVASEGPGPIVVSLRTEYKGQFDDRIAGLAGHPGNRLKGYFLNALGKEALVKAIRRPTLGDAEWAELVSSKKVKNVSPPSKRSGFDFDFPQDEAEYLAEQLLQPDAVPPGGVLPALQIACKRIYDQSKRSARVGVRSVVTRASIMRLGAIANQVEEYVSEAIEKACKGETGDREGDSHRLKLTYSEDLTEGQLIDLVHRALANAMVQVEPDGRAVTSRLTEEQMRLQLDAILGDRFPDMGIVLGYLVDKGVLRTEGTVAGQTTWSLGHDAIALALNKWRTKFGRGDASMMRMMMGAQDNHASWDEEKLFPEEDTPTPVKLVIARDFLWDRQLIHFADQKGFARRLGFEIEAPKNLDATKIDIDKNGAEKRHGPETWLSLAKSVQAIQQDPKDNRLALVSAEWGAFPLIIRDKDDKLDAKWVEEEGFDPRDYAEAWTDLCSTNINVGNGLIGPDIKIGDGPNKVSLKTASEIERGSEGLDYDGVRKVIKTVLLTVASKDSSLRVFDLRAQRLLLFAADLVFTKSEADQRDEVKAAINQKAISSRRDKYTVRDPVVAWLMTQENNKARKGDDKVTLGFAVAGAFPRAMSTQAGLKVYFGAKHIAALAREEMRIRALPENEVSTEGANAKAAAAKAASVGVYATNVRDLAAEVQKIISHTLWQVSISGANWENGADRARVLRLAALGYYATDYARVSMDEFVAFLQDFANGFLDRDMPGPGSLRGARLSRRQVENAVAECFSFARFEANTEDVFDLDAPFAYWSDHGDMGGKSVAQAIYQELMDLRQKALAHFDSAVGAISWLRYKDLYFPGKDPAVSEAYKAKEFAWRHFRIFNFYDAERYMGKASALLTRRLETVATDEKNIAKWREELRLESKRRESV